MNNNTNIPTTEHYLWAEKYRPKNLSEFVGSPEVKDAFSKYLTSGEIPHILLYGSAGCGKTSLAKLVVSSIPCDHLFINASD